MEKIGNYVTVAIVGGGFFGLTLSGLFGFTYGMISGIVLALISFHSFMKDDDKPIPRKNQR